MSRVARRSLKSHVAMIHENKKPILKKILICEVCGKGFSAPSKLAHHAISHLDREQSQMVSDITCIDVTPVLFVYKYVY